MLENAANPRSERELLLLALAFPPEQQPAFLDDACKGDLKLRDRLIALLQSAQAESAFMDGPALAMNQTTLMKSAAPGAKIDRYKLMEQIGEGGMGVVFVAEQSQPVRRNVALKLIKPGMDTKQVIARFEAERQALALMDHPNIARVLDAGTTDAGLPYFVMELVRGLPITEYCDKAKLSPKDRLQLFITVCSAVQHAHLKGIIHRDLKPNNILVTLHDGVPVVKVIDFGVAKALHQQLTQHTLYTALNQVMGTPMYMSPEQLELSGLDIDTRTDVYSLGVLLYELLTGVPPFEREELYKSGFDELRRIIREQDPPRPSIRVTTLDEKSKSTNAQRRGLDQRTFFKSYKAELDWIVMKALEKDRERRYESASEMAADVQRYLSDEPILACPPSRLYRWQKFHRKNKGPIAAVGLVLLTLICGMIGTGYGLVVANRERLKAVSLANKASASEQEAIKSLKAGTDEAIALLIGSKDDLGPQENAYLEGALTRWREFAEKQGEGKLGWAVQADGQFQMGEIYRRLGRNQDAASSYEQSVKFRKLAADSDKKDLAVQQQYANALRRLGEEHKALGKIAAATAAFTTAEESLKLLVKESGDLSHINDLARVHCSQAALLINEEKFQIAEAKLNLASEAYEKLRSREPTSAKYLEGAAIVATNRGFLSSKQKLPLDAVRFLETERELRLQLCSAAPTNVEYQTSLALVRSNLAAVLDLLKRPEEAEKEFAACLGTYEKLSQQFPGVAGYISDRGRIHLNLSITLGKQRKIEASFTHAEAAKKLFVALVEKYPSVHKYRANAASAWRRLASIHLEGKEFDQALLECNEAIGICQPLLPTSNRSSELVREYLRTKSILGDAYENLGRWKDAQRESEDVLQIRKSAAEHSPSPENLSSLASAYASLGQFLSKYGSEQEAAAHMQRAIDIYKELTRKCPDIQDYPRYLANNYLTLGNMLSDMKRVDEAGDAYQEAIRIREKLVSENPGNVDYRIRLSSAYINIGGLHTNDKHPEQGLPFLTKSIDILKSIPANSPYTDGTRNELRLALTNRAKTRADLKDYAGAIADANEALQLNVSERQRIDLNLVRAHVTIESGHVDQGIEIANQISTIPDLTAKERFYLACKFALASTHSKDRANEYKRLAVEHFKRANAAGFGDIEMVLTTASILTLKGDPEFDQLLDQISKAQPSAADAPESVKSTVHGKP